MIFSGLPVIRNNEGLECTLPTSILFHTSYDNLTNDLLSLLALYGIRYHEIIDELNAANQSKDLIVSEEDLHSSVLSLIKQKSCIDNLRLNYIKVYVTNKNDPVYDHILNTHLLVLDLDVIPLDYLK